MHAEHRSLSGLPILLRKSQLTQKFKRLTQTFSDKPLKVDDALFAIPLTVIWDPPNFMPVSLEKIHPCPRRRNKQSLRRLAGFTLIELLAVVGIIVVLAALLMPAVNGYLERAQGVVCAQNLRQIGAGLHIYISENNGHFPNGALDFSPNENELCWYDAAANNMAREYVPNLRDNPLPKSFGCPAGHGKAYTPDWPYTGDYAANGHLGNTVPTLAAVRRPSATPYVQDTVKQNQFAFWIYAPNAADNPSAFSARHDGRGNILWVDGHVSSFKYSEYMDFAMEPQHGGLWNFATGQW
jgi:general secretion pathway protein G